MEKLKIGYMCGVDYQHHIGEDNVEIYATMAECETKGCTHQCGIVQVEIKLVKWVKDQNFDVE